MSQVAHQARAYPGSLQRKVVFLPLPGWTLVHCRVTLSIKFVSTHLYTQVKRRCASKVSWPRT